MPRVHQPFGLPGEPMRILLLLNLLVCALLMLSACGEEAPLPAAQIEAAVESYLSERTDLRIGEMRVRADRIRYEGDRALASVSISASDDPKAAMQMVYELMRGADGWQVVPPQTPGHATGDDPQSQGTIPGLPPGHPPSNPRGMELPPGHPPTAPQGELPPGHPPIAGERL